MGNLPRSRPGRRSDKRASGSGAKARPKSAGQAKGAGGQAKGTAARSQAPRAKTAASRTGSARPARERSKPAQQPARGPDPLGDAVRVATKVAGAGIGVAAGILRRLPRP